MVDEVLMAFYMFWLALGGSIWQKKPTVGVCCSLGVSYGALTCAAMVLVDGRRPVSPDA